MRQPAVTVLDQQRDSLFLAAGQLEFLERSTLSPGDAVVVCATCRSVYREANWRHLQGVCACCAGQSTIAFRHSADALLARHAVRSGQPSAPNTAPPVSRAAAAETPAVRYVPLATLRHLLSAVVVVVAVAALIVLTSALGEAWRTAGPQRGGRWLETFAQQLAQGDGLIDPRNN